MAELPEEPNPSEGLLASWGRRLLAALRSMRLRAGPGIELRQDSEGTTVLLAKPPPNPNRERPFRARFMRASGTAQGEDVETGLFIYLPPETAEAVRWKGNVVPPAASQDLGTSENPWVEFDAGEGGKVYIEITFARQTGTGMSGELEPTEWKLAASASAASDEKWYHLVCAVEEDVGLVQYHLGSLLLGFGADLPCPDEYSVEERTGTGLPECVARRYVFKRMRYEKDSSGACQEQTGAGGSEETNIDIPKPAEYSLSVGGTACRKTVTLQKKPCGGSVEQAGDALTFDVPPSITATADGRSVDESSGRVIAGTVIVAPCGGPTTYIDILNGKDGVDGCTPAVSAEAQSADGRTLAGTITGCGEHPQTINIYNGKNGIDGAPGSVCGSFVAISGVQISTGTGGSQWLKFNLVTYTFQKRTGSDCYEPVAGADNWVEVLEFRSC